LTVDYHNLILDGLDSVPVAAAACSRREELRHRLGDSPGKVWGGGGSPCGGAMARRQEQLREAVFDGGEGLRWPTTFVEMS
jgi:hypothetical protein